MKEIKVLIPMQRITSVTEALRNSGLCDISAGEGCHNIIVSQVQRLYTSQDPGLQHYSMDLAEAVIMEAKLELICADELADLLTELITKAAQTGKSGAGWIFVSDIQRAVKIP
ncbi:MAG: P-II family nitrogen regulator [Burkholderiales bacterium]|jgi:nitrogen regulatory protein P-II 1|nr:P-II family nitrogen regulator [Burkholderiales bacterium]